MMSINHLKTPVSFTLLPATLTVKFSLNCRLGN
jgi:hypothetical protein